MIEVPSPAPRPRRRLLLGWIALAALATAYAGLAAFHVAYGAMNVDEGFYAAATRAVWQGEMPYRDFGFTQPPAVPYINAPLLAATGSGLFPQRTLSALWAALSVGLAAWLVHRRAGLTPALLLIALFALAPPWMYFMHLGKTYALASFLAVAATAIFLVAAPGWKKTVALSLVVALGTACRYPVAPFFGLVWLASLFESGRPSLPHLARSVGALGGSMALVFLPFLFAASEAFVFWTIDFHRVSVPLKDWRLSWNVIVSLAPAIWVLALAAVLLPGARRAGWQREHAVFAAALVALAFNLLPSGTYEEYGVPFLLPLAAASLILLRPAVSNFSLLRSSCATIALLAAAFTVAPAVNWHRLAPAQRTLPSVFLPPNAPPYHFELPADLAAAREVVRQLLRSDQPFVGSAIVLAAETGHPIPPRFRMGAFSMTFDHERERAHALHLATGDDFERALRDIDVPIVVLHANPKFNFAWSMPSFAAPPADRLREFDRLLSRYFVPVYRDPNFLILARPHLLPAVAP